MLATVKDEIPPGPIIELGCGTGIFSAHLDNQLETRDITFSDASEPMVELCKRKRLLTSPPPGPGLRNFAVATPGDLLPRSYSLIASSFMLQWLPDLSKALHCLLDCLVPGGMLLFSMPGRESFPEWRDVCARGGLIYTGNRLPDILDLVDTGSSRDCQFRVFSRPHAVEYRDSAEFFRSLRLSGSRTATGRTSTLANLRGIIKSWNQSSPNGIEVTYQLLWGYMRSPLPVEGSGDYGAETRITRLGGENRLFCDRHRY